MSVLVARYLVMPRLFLLRHAKARWAAPGISDFDRGLTQSGHLDAKALGTRMRSADFLPDLILCSTARRAVETYESLASTLFSQPPQTRFLAELYNSDALEYVCAVQEATTGDNILVIGHNPMMEDVMFELSSSRSDEVALHEASCGFPTCALAVVTFPVSLKQIEPRGGRLEFFFKPPHNG